MKLENLPELKFDQFWLAGEWASKQNFSSEDILNKQFENIKEPNSNLFESLSTMHKAFYPNENSKTLSQAKEYLSSNDFKLDTNTLVSDFLPWIIHQALFDAKKDKDSSLDDGQYKNILMDILQKEWFLTWHWRAVLPSLRAWQPDVDTKKFIIQISHIRKWEMLLCYWVESDLLKRVNKISEISLKEKNLLRAPLFGISHRLNGWDTYRLFYQEHISKYINKKLEEYKYSSDTSELAYAIGRHDCYYIVEDVQYHSGQYTWTLKAFLDTEPEIALIDEDILGKQGEDVFYYKPQDLIEIPSFKYKHEGIPQLLTSDNYCEAIYELTEVFNDPTVKSVLLIAPPGTGKEKLAQSAYYCRDSVITNHVYENNEDEPDGFIATTLAGLSADEAAKLLFSFSGTDSKLDEYTSQQNDGLIFKALDGALFIDEIDKTDKRIRDLLLRTLESGDITVPSTSQILSIPKDRTPLYIFAGSMSRRQMFQENPIDFWTRISHVIEVAHPLGIDDIDKAKKVVQDYLWMFWCNHVKEFIRKKGVTKRSDEDNLIKPLNDFYIELYKFLINKTTVRFATNILSDEISGRGKPLISIRTLRSVVARSIFKFVDILLYSKFQEDPIEIYKLNKKDEYSTFTPEKWFNNLVGIIKRENIRKYSGDVKIDALEFSIIESFRTAIRLGTALAQ